METDASSRMVLIIDDDPDFCNYLKMLLNDNGYEAVTLTNTGRGIDYLKMRKPDLITLDLMMPGEISGAKLFRFLRTTEEWKRIPVMIITGMSKPGERAETEYDTEYDKVFKSRTLPGPECYMEKPIEPARFIGEVRKLTGDKGE